MMASAPHHRHPPINPQHVPESQHSIFIRGFPGEMEMPRIRDFFEKEAGHCTFDFFKQSQDQLRLYVAVRFESRDIARECIDRFNNTKVLGHQVNMTWFKDIRRFAAYSGQRPRGYPPQRGGYYDDGYGYRDNYRSGGGNSSYYDDGYSRRPRRRSNDSRSPSERSGRYSSKSGDSRSRSRSASQSRKSNSGSPGRSAGSRSRSPPERYRRSRSGGSRKRRRRPKSGDSSSGASASPPRQGKRKRSRSQSQGSPTVISARDSPRRVTISPTPMELEGESSPDPRWKKVAEVTHTLELEPEKLAAIPLPSPSKWERETTPTRDEPLRKGFSSAPTRTVVVQEAAKAPPVRLRRPEAGPASLNGGSPTAASASPHKAASEAAKGSSSSVESRRSRQQSPSPAPPPPVAIQEEKNTTTCSSGSGERDIALSSDLISLKAADAALADVITEKDATLEKKEAKSRRKSKKRDKTKHLKLSTLSKETGADAERQRRIAGLGPERLGELQRKRKDLEAAYKQDCETFATVVKMLISKEPALEDKLLPSMRESLKDIGQKFIAELNGFVDGMVEPEEEMGE